MPIQVQLPDGSIGEFPDGMADADIERVLKKQFATPSFSNVTGSDGKTMKERGSLVNAEKRGLGLGARSALVGAADLFGAFGGDAFNRFILPGDQPSYRDAAGALADKLGLPAPKDSRERVLSDVGGALTGTGITMGLGGLLGAGRTAATSTGMRGRLADLLTTQPELQAVSAATGSAAAGMTRENGGSPTKQALAGVAGGLSPGILSTAGGASLRGAVRGADGSNMRRTIDDFSALGATPSLGQASGRHALQGVENLLAGAPTSAGVMNRFATRQAENIGDGLQRNANNLTPNASAERAGRAIERGVEVFGSNTKSTKKALYWQADQFIPSTTPVPLQNTWQEVVNLTSPMPGATATTKAMVSPRIAQLRDTLEKDLAAGGGNLSYEALKRIRTDIGEEISDFSLSPDSSTREMKRLYAALSRDMEAAAQSQGPQAVAAAKRANNYTRSVAERNDQIQRVIDKNGGPEAVYNAAMAGSRDGGTTLRSVMQSIPKDGQKAVTAAVIKRMGMANPGMQDAAGETFSAATFLTNWNRVSPEARRALFDRHGASFSKDMDRIARVAQNIKDGAKVFANPSGTANRAASLTYGASLVASLFDPSLISTGALVTSGVGANWLARKMTDPDFVKVLANSTALPVGSVVAQAQVLRNYGIRNNDPEAIAVAEALSPEP